jgi:DNA-binding NtrC family response regulator
VTIRHVSGIPAIIGTGPAAGGLREAADRLAVTSENVVLSGEPGTGKRFFAGLVHARRGSAGRVVVVEPSTPEEELRVILFDEERRKIEGMLGRAIGRLNEGDTLYVRNPSDFSILGQTRLARFLIQTDPSARRHAAAVHVVFALPAGGEVPSGSRRGVESLAAYLRTYRRITIPPLRERCEDIPYFILYFLGTDHAARGPLRVDDRTMARLLELPYYDNVRELRHLVRDAVAASKGEHLQLPSLVMDEVEVMRGLLAGILRGRAIPLESTLEAVERALIRRALIRSGFDRTRAAALIGLTELHIRYRIKKYGLGDLADPEGEDSTHVPGEV